MTRLRGLIHELRDNAEWYAYVLACLVAPAVLLVGTLLWRVTRAAP